MPIQSLCEPLHETTRVVAALGAALALLSACAPRPAAMAPARGARSEQPSTSPGRAVAITAPGTGKAALAPQVAAVPSVKPFTVKVLRDLPWGAGPLQAGRVLEGEQNPEAPMALDAGIDGAVWLLDQVNSRALRLTAPVDPKVGTMVQVPRTAQDLAVAPDGALWVMDRLVGQEVRKLDPQTGQVLATVPLLRPNLTEPGVVTALSLHQGAVWAELAHTRLVRLAGMDGGTLQPAEIPGRPTPDGRWLLQALRVPPDKVVVTGHSPTAGADTPAGLALEVQFPLPIWAIVELAGDSQGRIWLVADLVRLDASDKPAEERRMAVIWRADGTELARVELCAPQGPEETLRSARVGANGRLYNLCVRPQGARIEEVTP